VNTWFTLGMEYTEVSPEDIAELEGLEDWRVVLRAVHATFRAPSYGAAADLVKEIATIADGHQHHPDMEIRYPGRVHVRLTTHATGGLTTLDVDVARAVSSAAAAIGASSDPSMARVVEVTIDTSDIDRIRPFWRAVLDYRDDGDDLVDPQGEGPPVTFQTMDQPRPQRNRIHVDVSVPHDVAEPRIEAALAAGGTLVSDANARAWWVLADADGNEACVSTWQDR
jgi:4a-hydroxytetrahydrobiopterin dehydratase